MTGPREPCPACGGTGLALAFVVGPSAVWRCRGCGLGRTVPPPSESDGREHFAEDPAYFADAYAQPKDRWWHRFTEAPLYLLQAAGVQPGLRLLDVGCNLGYLVAAARKRGYEAIGIDGSPAAVAVGREQLGLNLICARIETASVEPLSQDVVILNHVLEHLPDPGGTLRRVRGWLRPGGFLLVGLPNFGSPIARIAGGNWAGLVPTQHIWHFTPAALSRFVGRLGFTHLQWRTCMLTYAPRGVTGWMKWVVRRTLEPLGLADNLLLLARRRVVESSE
jgi:SAM-dependent methyltransferase